MRSYTSSAFVIALKIWLAALCFNTFIGSFILSYSDHFGFGTYAALGAVIGGFCSAPIFIILWVELYKLLKANYAAAKIFHFVLITGLLLAAIVSALFSSSGSGLGAKNQEVLIFLLAPVSGALATILNYRSICNACRKRDEAFSFINNIGTTTE